MRHPTVPTATAATAEETGWTSDLHPIDTLPPSIPRTNLLKCFPEDGSPISHSNLLVKALKIPLAISTVRRLLIVLKTDGSILKLAHGQYCRKTVIN